MQVVRISVYDPVLVKGRALRVRDLGKDGYETLAGIISTRLAGINQD